MMIRRFVFILILLIFISCKDKHSKLVEKNNVDNIGNSYDRAEALFNQGDLQGALIELQSNSVQIASKPDPRRESLMGTIYQRMHRYKPSIEAYMKSLKNSASNKDAILSKMAKDHFDLGLLYQSLARLAAVVTIDYCTEKLRLISMNHDHNQPEQASNLSEVSNYINKLRESCYSILNSKNYKAFEAITSSKTEIFDPTRLSILANSHFKLASDYYVRSKINSLEKNYLLGVCYLESGNLDKSMGLFNAVLNGTDKHLRTKAAIGLGEAYYLSGFQEKAFRLWHQSLEENRGDIEINSEMAQAYCHLGIKLDEALQICNMMDCREPGVISKTVASIYLKIASQNRNIEMLSEAIRLFEKNRFQESGYSIETNDPRLLIDLAEAYYHRQTFGESAKIISHFLNEYPETTQIFDAIQMISEMRRRS